MIAVSASNTNTNNNNNNNGIDTTDVPLASSKGKSSSVKERMKKKKQMPQPRKKKNKVETTQTHDTHTQTSGNNKNNNKNKPLNEHNKSVKNNPTTTSATSKSASTTTSSSTVKSPSSTTHTPTTTPSTSTSTSTTSSSSSSSDSSPSPVLKPSPLLEIPSTTTLEHVNAAQAEAESNAFVLKMKLQREEAHKQELARKEQKSAYEKIIAQRLKDTREKLKKMKETKAAENANNAPATTTSSSSSSPSPPRTTTAIPIVSNNNVPRTPIGIIKEGPAGLSVDVLRRANKNPMEQLMGHAKHAQIGDEEWIEDATSSQSNKQKTSSSSVHLNMNDKKAVEKAELRAQHHAGLSEEEDEREHDRAERSSLQADAEAQRKADLLIHAPHPGHASPDEAEAAADLDRLEEQARIKNAEEKGVVVEEGSEKRVSKMVKKLNSMSHVDDTGRFIQVMKNSDDRTLSALTVVWDFGACGCTGWSLEAMNMVLAIAPHIGRMGIIASERCFCPGISAEQYEQLELLRTQPMDTWDIIDIFVSHKPPTRYPTWPYRGSFLTLKQKPLYIIGRSMTETTKITDKWVKRIQSDVDEVWVPSLHSLQAFKKAGVSVKKMNIIPEPIDPKLYDPLITNPLP